MEIIVRKACGYKDVNLHEGPTTIELGLHNHAECLALAKSLKGVIWDLLSDDVEEYRELMKEE